MNFSRADRSAVARWWWTVDRWTVAALVVLQSPRVIRRIALIGFVLSVAALAATFVVGVEIKGARRWINLPGLSLQPSEFVKPTFAVVVAWLLSEQRQNARFPGTWIAAALFLVEVGLLVKQPDLGMAVVVT